MVNDEFPEYSFNVKSGIFTNILLKAISYLLIVVIYNVISANFIFANYCLTSVYITGSLKPRLSQKVHVNPRKYSQKAKWLDNLMVLVVKDILTNFTPSQILDSLLLEIDFNSALQSHFHCVIKPLPN